MDRRRRAVVLLALVAIAVGVAAAWLAPAALLDWRIARATGGVLRLAEAGGTLRDGHGTVVAGMSQIPIAWHVEFRPLLRGVLRVQVGSGTGAATPRATIAVGTDTLALHDVDVTLPAEILAATLGQRTAGAVTGDVDFKADAIEWAAGSGRGKARVIWRAAGVVLPGSALPLDLGSVQTEATADGSVLSGPLRNEGGDVALRGEWTMRVHESAQLALHVTPRRHGLSDLDRMLSALGTRDGDGWRIDWRGALR